LKIKKDNRKIYRVHKRFKKKTKMVIIRIKITLIVIVNSSFKIIRKNKKITLKVFAFRKNDEKNIFK